jgi:hypothetical protein
MSLNVTTPLRRLHAPQIDFSAIRGELSAPEFSTRALAEAARLAGT